MTLPRRDFLKIAAAGTVTAGLLANARRAPAQVGKAPKKVIILGFDGASPTHVEQWMDAGILPNLAKLRSMGTYGRITTANPPQTPVSWAEFATGLNPGKTGLFDFLRRNPKTYMPELALVSEGMGQFGAGESNPLAAAAGAFVAGGVAGLVVKALYGVIKRRENPAVLKDTFDPRVLAAVAGIGVAAGAGAFAFGKEYVPSEMPHVENCVKGQTFWQFLDERSIPTLSFRVPARFPADKLSSGRAVAGLGVPDIVGTTGRFTYYTTEAIAPQGSGDTEMGGKVVPLYFKLNGESKTVVYGLANKLFLTDEAKELKKAGKGYGDKLVDLTIPLKLKAAGDSLNIETPDWSGSLKVGQWSKPVTFSFKFNPFLSVEAYGKFYLLELDPDVKLYLQPLSFHPKTMVAAHGPVRMSTPQSFIGDLYDKYGPFKTLGWASDTWALNELVIPEEVFLEDMYEFVGQYRAMMNEFLRSKEPLYVHVYSFTDRIAHMFWHHLDQQHPMYKPELAAKYAKVLQDAYKVMDEIVGDVVKHIDSDTWFFVLSDHGFHSFRRGLNINTWLALNGFLASKAGVAGKQMKLDDLFSRGDFWPNVDWTKTQAYALGLGAVYINVAGREAKGVVPPSQRDAVCRQIIQGLESYVDPVTGQKPVFKVYRREDAYSGFDPNDMPDLRAANAEGYRTGWQSTMGGIPPDVCDTNGRKWSGDHCSYEPSISKGIFFCNKQNVRTDPNLLDFFPTVVDLFGYGAQMPGDLDGTSLIKKA